MGLVRVLAVVRIVFLGDFEKGRFWQRCVRWVIVLCREGSRERMVGVFGGN